VWLLYTFMFAQCDLYTHDYLHIHMDFVILYGSTEGKYDMISAPKFCFCVSHYNVCYFLTASVLTWEFVIWVSSILSISVKVGQTFSSRLLYCSSLAVIRSKLERCHPCLLWTWTLVNNLVTTISKVNVK
jgi:hypothetical protein